MVHWIARTYYWLTERLYHELAWFYDTASWLVSLGQWDTCRKYALDFLAGTEILEIGFGTGELLLEMARRNIHVIGLDSSSDMHRITGKKLLKQGLDIPRILGKIQQTPFKDNSFDTIISTFPAGYIFDHDTWCEAASLLRKNKSLSHSFSSRFVVVGLFTIRTTKLRLPGTTSLLQHTYDDVLARIRTQAESVGLDLRIEIRSFPGHALPIIIAEKPR